MSRILVRLQNVLVEGRAGKKGVLTSLVKCIISTECVNYPGLWEGVGMEWRKVDLDWDYKEYVAAQAQNEAMEEVLEYPRIIQEIFQRLPKQ